MVAHVAAVADDWADGRLSGPPTDETAAQIARFGYDLAEILAARTDAAARLDRMAETAGVAPRSAASSFMSTTSSVLSVGPAPGIPRRFGIPPTYCSRTSAPVPLRVTVEDAQYRSGPGDRAEIRLRTARFEALRWRTGRRSRAELAAMDWSGDPTPVLDHRYMFGPADADIVE